MSICENCQQPGEIEKFETGDETWQLCGPCRVFLDRHSVQLSPLSRGDLELVLAWRSNPKIYRYFRRQDGPLNWKEHIAWFDSRDAKRHDFIIHFGGRRTGVVSLSETDDVGIFLGDFSARGRGIATATLNWLCNRFDHRTPMNAEVHHENQRSQKLFERCGFTQKYRENGWLQYIYDD